MTHKGIGDTLEYIFERTGAASIAHTYSSITGNNCNCQQRRDTLNKVFPYPFIKKENKDELE